MPPHFRIRGMAGSFPPRESAPSPNAFTAALHVVVPSSPPLVENFCKAEMTHSPLSALRPAGQRLLTQWKHQHALKGIFHSPRAKVMNGSFLGFEWAGLPSFTDPLGGAFRGRDLCRGPLQLESLHPLRSQDPRITRPPLRRIEKGSGADPGQNWLPPPSNWPVMGPILSAGSLARA